MSNYFGLLSLLLISLMGSLTCSLNIAGGSSDHGNAAIGGILSDSLNNGIANVTVRLLPADFNPAADDFNPDSLTAQSDSAGFYKIEYVPRGTYCLTGTSSDSALKTYQKAIVVDTTDILTLHAILQKPGNIKIPVDTALWLFDNTITVFIPGTNIYYTTFSLNDTIELKNIPSGSHTVRMYSAAYDSIIAIDEEFSNVHVKPGVINDFTIYPKKPRGPATGVINDTCKFFSIFSYKGWISNIAVQCIEYRFAWGNADTSSWSTQFWATHAWSDTGSFEVRAQIRYTPNLITQEYYNTPFCSGWSEAGLILISNE